MGEAAAKDDPLGAHLAVSSDNLGAWARTARAAGETRLREVGLPGRRDEYWRYTDPAPLITLPAPQAAVFETDEAPVFGDVDALEIVFVDGVFREDLSDPLALEACEVERLADAMAKDIHWASDLFGTLETAAQVNVPRPLAALNTATATDGLVVRVTGKPARPLSLRYLHQNPASDATLRHLIRIEPGAEATLLESGPAAARLNQVTEVDVAKGGAFHMVRTQGRDHERRAATATFAKVAANASFKAFTMTVNGVLTRNEMIVDITGDDAIVHVAGACAGDGDFHHDDTVFITHDGVGCESRQVYKKVLKNGATGVFQGKILVKPDAQKTDGYQISQGLLLDEASQFLAKPELEIYADDVACSHGSTCGSVDETALYYLRSRGVPEQEATNMLVLAFLAEALDEIADQNLREVLTDRLNAWLARHV